MNSRRLSPTAAYRWALDAGWSGTSTGGNRGGAAAGERYGQVTGVDVDRQGRIWVLQRTPERSWDAAAFTRDHHIRYKAPIKGNTIVRYASEDATAVDLAVGGGLFQMPHMIKVDGGGNVWVVDCGLHQVLKYAASAAGTRTKPERLPKLTATDFAATRLLEVCMLITHTPQWLCFEPFRS